MNPILPINRPFADASVRDCRLIGCEFDNVGFTGSEDILEQLAAIPTLTAPQA